MRTYRTLIVALGTAITIVGCSAGTERADTTGPSSSIEVKARAELDRQNAVIVTPLAAYGMSAREVQVVKAAQQIAFTRCLKGDGVTDSSSVDRARKELAAVPTPNHWVIGLWDAEFVASKGLGLPSKDVGLGPDNVAPEAGSRCVESEPMRELALITPHDVTADLDRSGLLVQLSQEATLNFQNDARLRSLVDEKAACVKAKGYALDPDGRFAVVDLAALPDSEAKTKATLTEAQCADEVGFPQSAGDLLASHEQAVIDHHKAELVTLRSTVDARVGRATSLLREAGITVADDPARQN